ncbi:MAG: nicotinate phosphoribosyltransferase [Chlamydia sp. 32-24]|nr:MAG: nicotinate phosphoribosyltransferase [Chlamydia sp. 32-24]
MPSSLSMHSSLALLTDLYQLTMCYGYWKAGLEKKEAVFHLFFRKLPFQGGFAVASGLEAVIEFLQKFNFSEDDLRYLSQLKTADGKKLFDKKFLDYLKNLTFSCDLHAIPEGTIVFPYEPLLRIQGPLIECQILESILLNLVNFPSLIATKAARVFLSAKGDPVIEFGMRRAQGIDGALTASRSAYIGGCEATSNVLAGKIFNIPVRGTHSHSWVMAFDDELESFQTYAKNLSSNCVFLVDTYDSIEGVKKAIEVGKWLKTKNKKLLGIRLDSGDLADISIRSRELLDQAGFNDTFIMASNELDEEIISELKKQGAQIHVWGVGTSLATGKSQSSFDGVYKLSAIRDQNQNWKYKLKLSEQLQKVSNPGILQVKRFFSEKGNIADLIYDVHLGCKNSGYMIDPIDLTKKKQLKKETTSVDLLVPIFIKGKLVYKLPTLQDIRQHTIDGLRQFPFGVKRLLNPHQYFVGMEKNLHDLKIDLIQSIRSQTSDVYLSTE